MSPSETFCCLPALDRGIYPTDAVAAVDSVVVRVPLDIFHQALGRSPSFMEGALCLFCDRLRQVEQKSCMIYEPAEQRLAQALMGLMKKFGAIVPLTRQELAEIAGTTHETAIRTLSRLAKDGIIRSSRGQLTILKADRLRDIADGA
jgi:CRP-like cAMP-binding protein